MGLSVKERGAAVATFRYVHVALMEMLAQWTPTTPEMEVKLLFGEHIWDMAQQADALGRRTQELRLPLQHSLAPVGAYVRLLEEVREQRDTARRLAGFYDALLPPLAGRYRGYLDRIDTLMDAPTVRILEQCSDVESRMIRQSRELRAEFPALAGVNGGWLEALLDRDTRISDLVAPGAPAEK
jgi:hypothetical protein